MAKSLQILDATLRDGGLVNDFRFQDGFVKALYQANLEAGIDCMELGYRADRKQFPPEQYGKWKYACDDDIRAVVGENRTSMKLSVMVDVGRCDPHNDIRPKSESPVDLFRIAAYLDGIPEALRIIDHVSRLGYETSCNLMAVSRYSRQELTQALRQLAGSPVQTVYIVDSYGALYPRQIGPLADLYSDILLPAGKTIGFHAHNNQQCAFANTLEAVACGIHWADATVFGMGRGAGNCHLEALLGALKLPRYRMEPLLQLIEDWMLPMKHSGIEWGYNTSYLLTGLANRPPQAAISASRAHDTAFTEQLLRLNSR